MYAVGNDMRMKMMRMKMMRMKMMMMMMMRMKMMMMRMIFVISALNAVVVNQAFLVINLRMGEVCGVCVAEKNTKIVMP